MVLSNKYFELDIACADFPTHLESWDLKKFYRLELLFLDFCVMYLVSYLNQFRVSHLACHPPIPSCLGGGQDLHTAASFLAFLCRTARRYR